MEFTSERAALTALSELMVKCGVCLYNAVKYLYSLAAEDFYHVSIKDCLKVILNNITDADSLQTLTLRISNERCGEMNSPEYNRVLHMMVYSFAVRIPLMKKIKNGSEEMTEEQLHQLYEMVMEKGAANYADAIKESYLENRYLVKKNKPVAPYTAEWYKDYITREVPALAVINNKNMFLRGVVDILFSMYYPCMEEELKNVLLSHCAKRKD